MIKLTESAAFRMLHSLKERGRGIGIRIGLKTTGCSGLTWVFEYVDEPAETDLVLLEQGVQLFVDPKDVPYIEETEIDFVRQGLNSGYEFRNPNERNRCGCGESFSV